MNVFNTLKHRYCWILILCMIIGVISGSYLVYERIQIEKAQNSIENIVDYEAAMRVASYEKGSEAESFQALKDAGVTALAIYDQTLQKESDAGHIVVYQAKDMNNIQVYGANVVPGYTYVFAVPGQEGYFKEVKEDLYQRLGYNKVEEINTSRGPAIALHIPYESLMDMKLSISRLQAEEVVRKGFHVIVRPTNFKNETKDDVDFVFRRIQGVPNVTGMVFVGKEVLGYPNNLNDTLAHLRAQHIPVVGIEAVNQLQYDKQLGFDYLAAQEHYSVGRLYTVTKDEMKKLTPAQVTQWFFISDIERNIRYNLYPLYEAGVDNHTALGTSLLYMNGVKEKLEHRGFTFGRPSIYPDYQPKVVPLVLTMLGAIALFVFTLSLFIRMTMHRQMVVFCTLLLLGFLIFLGTTGRILAQCLALSSAITAPVAAMVLIMDCWAARGRGAVINKVPSLGQAILYVVGAAAFAAMGGIFIAAMLGNTRFFMEFSIFRGVKLTFIAPVILTLIAYFMRFPIWKGRAVTSSDDAKALIRGFFQSTIKVYSLCIVGVLLLVAYVFVGRSGHTAGVPVPGIELTLRRFLEDTLYARPREKEFLIGYPALMLASYGWMRRWPMTLHCVLTIVGVIGVASMVETFCHIRTPVLMSLCRGWDGLWLGCCIGIVAVLIAQLLIYLTRWYQSREVHHG